MSTEVRWRRGTTAENNNFTGAEAEITVDTERGEVRVHDGVIPGGTPVKTGFTVSTLADLQALSSSTGARSVQMLGRSTVGDGAAGTFVWDGSDLSTEVSADEVTADGGDGGIYVAPAGEDGSNGAWVRQFSGAVNVLWYGASGSATTNDVAFQNAITSAQATKTAVTVPLANLGYNLTQITILEGVTLRGESIGNTKQTQDIDPNDETGKIPFLNAKGTVNTPLVIMQPKAGIENLRMTDFRQKFEHTELDEAVNDTQYAIQVGDRLDFYADDGAIVDGVYINNITPVGFTRFVVSYQDSNDNVPNIENITVNGLRGMPFEIGVELPLSADVSSFVECQFIPNSIRTYANQLGQNLARSVVAWRIGRADGLRFDRCQAFGVKRMFHFDRDLFNGDDNRFGGFTMQDCRGDNIGQFLRDDRDSGNVLGGNIIGGQTSPIVILPNNEENTPFYLNETDGGGLTTFTATCFTIQEGATNPTNTNVMDSPFFGANSVKTYANAAEFKGNKTSLVFVGCNLRVPNNDFVDEAAATSNSNSFSIINSFNKYHELETLIYNPDGENNRLLPSGRWQKDVYVSSTDGAFYRFESDSDGNNGGPYEGRVELQPDGKGQFNFPEGTRFITNGTYSFGVGEWGFQVVEGSSEPAGKSGFARIFMDTNRNLKIKFDDGVVTTIQTA